MSGARGSARTGKRKLVCKVQRTDRVGVRTFSTHLFVRADRAMEPGEIAERLRAKYAFPVTLVRASVARAIYPALRSVA
jgi:hypothetical protein